MTSYRLRHDGWTPQRRRAFLRALGETGCVRDACARARISNTSAYRMRKRCPVFAKAWDRALTKVAPTIEQAAFERAVNGWEEPVWHGGKLVGYRRRFSDGLLRLLLTRGTQRGAVPEAEADPFPRSKGWDRATQAETDAQLLANLKAFRRRLEAEKAQKALPAPGTAATTPPTEQGEGDADDADRGTAGAVRDGDGPRIWTLPG
ncbi:hypothetical protein [uncultured Sphingomonas sp.]|uniref:hypothetical protein n=1 Tax=uncultured Sphingomonas sp. TaxID=158754 RepID=UPI00258D09FB|nr:hypothetical protein [uncultured Sphingomonas sp.]